MQLLKNNGHWFGLVLWPINHFSLFNAKSSLYIYMICKHILSIHTVLMIQMFSF